MNPTMPSVDRVTLEWIKVAVADGVSPEFAADVRADIENGPWGHLVYQMASYVLTDKLPPEVVTERGTFHIEVPASPWQQFKATHSDRWWMRRIVARRPVRMVEHARTAELVVNLERFHAYPQAKYSRELGRPTLSFMLTRQFRWDES